MTQALKIDHLDLLIHLLDDPDQEAFGQVCDEILAIGARAIEPLEEAWFSTTDQLTRRRIEEIVNNIQHDSLYGELAAWVAAGADDLLHGYVIATRFQYPNLDEDKLLADLNKLIRSVWIELNDNLTSLEKVKVLNHVLFGVNEIKGSVKNRVIPDHYFLNNLLQSKRGNSISIGMLYIIVANRLLLPVKGVDLTGNFIACFTHQPSDFENEYKPLSEVKFYINPFAAGAVFTRKEIHLYLEKSGIEPAENCFKPIDNIAIMRRWCHELSKAYSDSGMPEKARKLKAIIKILR